MNEKTDRDVQQECDAFSDWIRPHVTAGFASIGGPDARTLLAIQAEAASNIRGRRRSACFLFYSRVSAAAAAILLLSATSVYIHGSCRAGQHAHTLNQLLDLGATVTSSSASSADSDEFAQRLLTVQGLDQEAFLASAEMEPLWL